MSLTFVSAINNPNEIVFELDVRNIKALEEYKDPEAEQLKTLIKVRDSEKEYIVFGSWRSHMKRISDEFTNRSDVVLKPLVEQMIQHYNNPMTNREKKRIRALALEKVNQEDAEIKPDLEDDVVFDKSEMKKFSRKQRRKKIFI